MITLSFIVCMGPYRIVSYFTELYEPTKLNMKENPIFCISIILVYLNSLMNPIIYIGDYLLGGKRH